MNKKIWKQTDSRWAGKYYPNNKSLFGGNGCGCCACVHDAMEQARYKDWTPESLRPWMVNRGFAVQGQGTTWAGMVETLKHIGHDRVVWITESMPMSDAWKELDKGNRIGVILFYGGYSSRKKKYYRTPDGTVWTGNGHYVAFVDYKVDKNGKHWFYTKDSGGRNHDGWYCYETSMKGCAGQVFIVERTGRQVGQEVKATDYRPGKPYNGALPNDTVDRGTTGSDAEAVQTFLNWCINAKLTVDGIAGEKTEEAIEVYEKTYKLDVDGIFGPKCKKKAKALIKAKAPKDDDWRDKGIAWAKKIADDPKAGYRKWSSDKATHECLLCHPETDPNHKWYKYSWNCIGFVFAVLKHGCGLAIKCSCHTIDNAFGNRILNMKKADALKLWEEKVGLKGWVMIRNKNGIPASKLKKCDALLYFEGSTFTHMLTYAGNDKVVDDGGWSDKSKQIAVRDYKQKSCKIAFSYRGK